MDRFDRIFALHQIISSARYPVPAKRILEELECSSSTFMRLVKAMRLYLSAPLEYDRKLNGWYYDKQGDHPYELPGLWFNAKELSALISIDHMLRELQPGLLDTFLDPLKKRLEQLLQTQQLGNGRIDQRIKLIGIGVRRGAVCFQPVAQAVLQRKQLHFNYNARSSRETSERTVSPQRLIYYRNNWYLDAWCHLRDQLRSFSLDRIESVQFIEQDAIHIQAEQLNEHYAQAYGIFAGNARERRYFALPRIARAGSPMNIGIRTSKAASWTMEVTN